MYLFYLDIKIAYNFLLSNGYFDLMCLTLTGLTMSGVMDTGFSRVFSSAAVPPSLSISSAISADFLEPAETGGEGSESCSVGELQALKLLNVYSPKQHQNQRMQFAFFY